MRARPPASVLPETFAELLRQIGDVSPARIRLHPALGTATEEDVVAALDGPEKRLCERIDVVVRLVWFVQPRTQTATVYTSPTKSRRVGKDQALDGGAVLPGFRLSLKELFARARRRQPKSR